VTNDLMCKVAVAFAILIGAVSDASSEQWISDTSYATEAATGQPLFEGYFNDRVSGKTKMAPTFLLETQRTRYVLIGESYSQYYVAAIHKVDPPAVVFPSTPVESPNYSGPNSDIVGCSVADDYVNHVINTLGPEISRQYPESNSIRLFHYRELTRGTYLTEFTLNRVWAGLGSTRRRLGWELRKRLDGRTYLVDSAFCTGRAE
jgi:hypothetical protein